MDFPSWGDGNSFENLGLGEPLGVWPEAGRAVPVLGRSLLGRLHAPNASEG